MPFPTDRAHAAAVWAVLACVLAGGLSAHYPVEHVGINTDTADMIAKDPAWYAHGRLA